jgi:hypothetical protein
MDRLEFMNAVPFDTLKFARKLEASRMAAGTAAGMAMTGAELATKTAIAGTHTAIAGTYTAIASLRTELKGDIEALRIELKGDISGLRAEVKSDIELLRRDLVIKLGSIVIVGVGVLLAAMRYMPVHP